MNEPTRADNAIREARKWSGFASANKAAKAAGLDQSYYNKLENKTRRPSTPALISLSRTFGCSTDQLLGLDPLPERQHAAAS